jgi:hypothetical protein
MFFLDHLRGISLRELFVKAQTWITLMVARSGDFNPKRPGQRCGTPNLLFCWYPRCFRGGKAAGAWRWPLSTLRLGGTATPSPPYAFMAHTGTTFNGYVWWREQVRVSDRFYSALLSLSVSQYTSLPLWKLSFRNFLFSCYFLLNQNNFLGPMKVYSLRNCHTHPVTSSF